jgi:glycosylphosphatidylinositol transamidase (GPIT) subunit GPI8
MPVSLLLPFVLVPICGGKNSALIVSTSRYWSNYRDSTNVGVFYKTVSSLGIPERRIVSMFSEDISCNPRNPFPGLIHDSAPMANQPISFGPIAIRGNEVSRDNFFRILQQRQVPYTPRGHRLDIDKNANLFVYFTGHSAVGYTKFQDYEDVDANDIALALDHLSRSESYNQIFWIGDTCRAASIHNTFNAPNMTVIGSSNEEDKSYSMPIEPTIGQSLIDRFTVISDQVFANAKRNVSVRDYIAQMDARWLGAEVTHRVTDGGVGLDAKLIDFLGGSTRISRSRLVLGSWKRCPMTIIVSDIAVTSRLSSHKTVPHKASKPSEINFHEWSLGWVSSLVLVPLLLVC